MMREQITEKIEGEEPTASTHKRHWVEELFPPTFSYAENDNKLEETLEEKEGGSDETRKRDDLLKRGSRPVKVVDPQEIKNVYQRVFYTLQLEQEQKKLLEQQQEKLIEDGAEFEPLRKTEEKGPTTTVDIDSDELWDSQEISVLREVFKRTRDENRKLKATVESQTRDIASLRSRYKRECDTLETRTAALRKADAANRRFQIAVATMKSETDECRAKIGRLTAEIHALRLERVDAREHAQTLRLDLERERQEKRRLALEAREKGEDAARESRLKIDALTIAHGIEIADLTNRIGELTDSLERERQSHSTDRRGLEHLRNHFSNLPLNDKNIGSTLTKLELY
ncbi:uncharacterized protein LOC141911098 [Tubulanus polymorphus]|uniref:uncharacterized protein LOC141911098 n=1 Tax=Tubulanus polymorphus TaxID=672921 RepID=UPI003DA4D698